MHPPTLSLLATLSALSLAASLPPPLPPAPIAGGAVGGALPAAASGLDARVALGCVAGGGGVRAGITAAGVDVGSCA
jgi:hypothetical protein